jgi:hypothetical protein
MKTINNFDIASTLKNINTAEIGKAIKMVNLERRN